MTPHLERTSYPWNWTHFPADRVEDEVTPWVEAFVNAKEWIKRENEIGDLKRNR